MKTKIQMSKSKSGSNNFYFGKSLNPITLLAAQKVRGKKIYVYTSVSRPPQPRGRDSEKDKSSAPRGALGGPRRGLINDLPFVSIRETVKHLPISPLAWINIYIYKYLSTLVSPVPIRGRGTLACPRPVPFLTGRGQLL